MFNFIGFIFSLSKGIYNKCAIHTQVNRQVSVARILFAGFFGIFSTSINKILSDAQIKEYITKLSTTLNTYDELHNNTNTLPTAPQIPSLNRNHALSLVPGNFRNLALVNIANSRPNHIQSPIQHIVPQQPQTDNTYKQYPIRIIPLFAFLPTESPHVNTSSGMDSYTYSDIPVFNTISQFNKSDIETPDKIANYEPSPPAFSQPPFRPIHAQYTNDSPSSISHISQATPTYSPFTNDHSNNDSPETTQISQKIDNLITLKQQIQHPHTLTIHQLSSNVTSSNPPTPTTYSDYTPFLDHSPTSTQSSSTTSRAYRTFKRKFPNHPFSSKPGTARDYVNHPDHINIPAFLQTSLPLFPQYTISHSNPHTEQPHYVDEHVLNPTLHWT